MTSEPIVNAEINSIDGSAFEVRFTPQTLAEVGPGQFDILLRLEIDGAGNVTASVPLDGQG